MDNLNETATPVIDNQETIHAKGFDLFDFGFINALENNQDKVVDYGKIKIGVK